MGNRNNGRGKLYDILREGNHLIPFNDEYGNQIMLNPTKHFLLQKPYKNIAYNRELASIAQKFNEYLKSKRDEGVKND